MHRPHHPVAVLGHRGHGKSTLCAALAARTEARALRGDPLDVRTCRAPVTSKRLTLLDVPGGPRSVRAALRACAVADAAVLVVSLTNGPQAQTRDHILAAKAAGLSPLIVVLNDDDKDGDKALREICEIETRAVLVDHGEGGDDAVVVVTNLQEADPRAVDAILAALEQAPLRAHDDEAPALVRVLFQHPRLGRRHGGARAVVSGRVLAGNVKPGDEVRVLGGRTPILPRSWLRFDAADLTTRRRNHDVRARVVRVEVDNGEVVVGRAGEHVGVELEFVANAPVVDRQCSVLVSTTHPGPSAALTATLTLRPSSIGGRAHPLRAGFECLAWTGSSSTACVVLPVDDAGKDAIAFADETFQAAILLGSPRFAPEGAPVTLTGDGGVIASGVILKSLVQADANGWFDRLVAVRAARANRPFASARARRELVNA